MTQRHLKLFQQPQVSNLAWVFQQPPTKSLKPAESLLLHTRCSSGCPINIIIIYYLAALQQSRMDKLTEFKVDENYHSECAVKI